MKSFLNYSKNRILYNIFRFLLVFLFIFLLSKCNVKALQSGENFSEFATSKREMARFYTSLGSVMLYGNNGNSTTCGTYSSPNAQAYLTCWANRTLSLVTYDTSMGGYNTSMRFLSNIPIVEGGTYKVTINYILASSNYTDIKNHWTVDYGNYELESFSSTCSGLNCKIEYVITSSETSDYVWLQGNNSAVRYTFQQFNTYIAYMFLPLVEVVSSDGSINLTPIIDQNQTIIDQNNQTNEKLDNIDNTLKDETPPNTDNLQNSAGWLPAGPVDSILNLPFTLFNSILDNLGTSCSPVDLPLPYVNKTLTLPCFNSIADKIDGFNVFWTSSGVIAAAFILYSYLMRLYKWVDDTLTFRENTYGDWGGV